MHSINDNNPYTMSYEELAPLMGLASKTLKGYLYKRGAEIGNRYGVVIDIHNIDEQQALSIDAYRDARIYKYHSVARDLHLLYAKCDPRRRKMLPDYLALPFMTLGQLEAVLDAVYVCPQVNPALASLDIGIGVPCGEVTEDTVLSESAVIAVLKATNHFDKHSKEDVFEFGVLQRSANCVGDVAYFWEIHKHLRDVMSEVRKSVEEALRETLTEKCSSPHRT